MVMGTCFCYALDIITTTDGQRIEAKITEVTKHEIKYKDWDNLDGPIFVLETQDISSVTYKNGKVVSYNQGKSQTKDKAENPKETVKLQKQTNKVTNIGLHGEDSTALVKYLDGFPKNVVAISGNYAMLYNKKSKIYFDFDYKGAEWVVYDSDADEYEIHGAYEDHQKDDQVEIDNNLIVRSTCDIFNKKMLNKKCTLHPLTDLGTMPIDSAHDYTMELHINRIDIGNGAVSVMTDGRTNAGGVTISGFMEIRNATNDSIVAVLFVDRVKGRGVPFEHLRISYAIQELITNKLFFIREFNKNKR